MKHRINTHGDCTACKLNAHAKLTTHCSGKPVGVYIATRVLNNEIDYRDGGWLKVTKPTNNVVDLKARMNRANDQHIGSTQAPTAEQVEDILRSVFKGQDVTITRVGNNDEIVEITNTRNDHVFIDESIEFDALGKALQMLESVLTSDPTEIDVAEDPVFKVLDLLNKSMATFNSIRSVLDNDTGFAAELINRMLKENMITSGMKSNEVYYALTAEGKHDYKVGCKVLEDQQKRKKSEPLPMTLSTTEIAFLCCCERGGYEANEAGKSNEALGSYVSLRNKGMVVINDMNTHVVLTEAGESFLAKLTTVQV